MERDWVPVEPVLVCEVGYDQVDGRRFRHPARFRHWRPDRDARLIPRGPAVVRLPAPVRREPTA